MFEQTHKFCATHHIHEHLDSSHLCITTHMKFLEDGYVICYSTAHDSKNFASNACRHDLFVGVRRSGESGGVWRL